MHALTPPLSNPYPLLTLLQGSSRSSATPKCPKPTARWQASSTDRRSWTFRTGVSAPVLASSASPSPLHLLRNAKQGALFRTRLAAHAKITCGSHAGAKYLVPTLRFKENPRVLARLHQNLRTQLPPPPPIFTRHLRDAAAAPPRVSRGVG